MKLSRALALVGLTRSEAATPAPSGIFPPPRPSTLFPESAALTLDAVYRAVSVLETAGKQLSLDVWRTGIQLEGDAIPKLIASPSPTTTPTDLIAETIASLALRGNAYWLIGRTGDGRAEALRVLDPLECVPVLDSTTGTRLVQWRGKTYDQAAIRHLRLLRVPGKAEGLGPIQACMSTLSGAKAMSEYASQWVGGSGIPTGILSTDQDITAEQSKQAKAAWMESNAPGAGIAVIGKGLHFSPTILKPAEVQFLESRAFDVLAVGRMFGIPAHMLLASVDGSSMTYQNVNDAATDFIRWTAMGYLREIEDALTALLPRATVARFNLDALLRADTAERMTTHSTAIAAGIYPAEYARKIEGITL